MLESDTLASLASLPSPLPPAPEGEVFTEDQWAVLFSILEVFVPAILGPDADAAISQLKPYLPQDATDDAIIRSYLAEDAVARPEYRDAVKRKFKLHVPPADAQGLGFILSTLNTRLGSYILTGYTQPIHTHDLATRTKIICQWPAAQLGPLRTIYRSMSGLARQTWLTTSPSLPKMLDFPATPKHVERNPSFDFKFHDFTDASTSTTLSADVVIVGSGCGAGVVASHLSRSGLKCLVLEKSYHFPSTHFPMSSGDSGEHLMENGGMVVSDDGAMGILAGSTFGGGGTINWSASLQPPHAVRQEWASDGLPHFLGAEFQACLDTICERMGVAKTTDPEALGKIEHNFANQTLLEGCRRIGMPVQIVPQNTASKRHFCGYCTYGCAGATKQGPANCWFPEAAAHGADFIEGCWVEEVLFADSSKQKATGVKATWTSRDRQTTRQLTISAPRVVISSGTLQSPLILQRSGLNNPHIGANLHLHPTATVWGTWPQRTNPWEGAILTVAMTGLEDLDGEHHGAKVEVICSTPGLGLLTVPFRPALAVSSPSKDNRSSSSLASAIEYRLNAAKHGFSTGFVCIARDKDTGRVYFDPKDPTRRRMRVAYTPSARDSQHILEGAIGGLRVMFTMGAVELESTHPSLERWVRPSRDAKSATSDEESFSAWIDRLRQLGWKAPDPCTSGSAHQMGTCRMGGSAKTGVVDSKGKVFGTEGLYVADASVFPSASGVNPMISTMGIAEWISRGIAKETGSSKMNGHR
jgi:choline dehydrogenase-like flavoprotein